MDKSLNLRARKSIKCQKSLNITPNPFYSQPVYSKPDYIESAYNEPSFIVNSIFCAIHQIHS